MGKMKTSSLMSLVKATINLLHKKIAAARANIEQAQKDIATIAQTKNSFEQMEMIEKIEDDIDQEEDIEKLEFKIECLIENQRRLVWVEDMFFIDSTHSYGKENFPSFGIDWYSLLEIHPWSTHAEVESFFEGFKTSKEVTEDTEALELLDIAALVLCDKTNRLEFDRKRKGSDLGSFSYLKNGESSFSSELNKFKKQVFDSTPQNPHFRRLDKYGGNVREGMKIGLDIALVKLSEEIRKLDNPESIWSQFDCFKKQLIQLEEMGYNVEKLTEKLETLKKVAELYRVSCDAIEKSESELRELENNIVNYKLCIVELEAKIEETKVQMDKCTNEIDNMKINSVEAASKFALAAKNM